MGKENDIFLLGCAIAYLLTGGLDLYKEISANPLYNIEAIKILEETREAHSLIKKLVNRDYRAR